MKITNIHTERIANTLTWYICKTYGKSKHVSRVTGWIGFILKAIQNVTRKFDLHRTRQLLFHYKGRRFIVKFRHTAGLGGGIIIAEYLRGPGGKEGATVVKIRNIAQAQRAYHTLRQELKRFIRQTPPQ